MIKNRILVVTGMHRSGTSVITQWLSRCGLHVGNELIGAETGNEGGHFEDTDFLHAHQSILRGRRLTDEGYTDPIQQLSGNERDVLKDIIAFKNNFNEQWGWKDPRTCLFLGTYRQLIPHAFYFVVLRDYQSVVSSLILRIYNRTVVKYASRKGVSKFIWEHIKKRTRMNMLLKKHSQRYLKVWIAYNEAILQHLQQLQPNNYIIVDYLGLCENDETIFKHLTGHWGLTLNFLPFTEVYNSSLMHHAPLDIGAYIKDKTLAGRATAVEGALRQLITLNRQPQKLVV